MISGSWSGIEAPLFHLCDVGDDHGALLCSVSSLLPPNSCLARLVQRGAPIRREGGLRLWHVEKVGPLLIVLVDRPHITLMWWHVGLPWGYRSLVKGCLLEQLLPTLVRHPLIDVEVGVGRQLSYFITAYRTMLDLPTVLGLA